VKAQCNLIQNGGFETVLTVPTPNYSNAFAIGMVDNWSAFSSSPEIRLSDANIASNRARIVSGTFNSVVFSEAFAQNNLNIVSGQSYLLRYSYRTPLYSLTDALHDNNLTVSLTNGTSTTQNWSVQYATNSNFQTVEFVFTATANSNTLIFRNNIINASILSVIELDNVELIPFDNLDESTCAGTPVTIGAEGNCVIPGENMQWRILGDATIIETSETIVVNPTMTTTYELTKTINGIIYTDNVIVTVNPNPSNLTFSETIICNGETISISTNDLATYNITSNGTNFTLSNGNLNANPTTNTVYSITGNLNGCLSTYTQNVTVNPLPTISISAQPSEICAGNTTQLAATGANLWNWAPNPTLSSTAGNAATANPITTTSYTVTGTSLTTGCSNSASKTIIVFPNTLLFISAISTTNFCTGDAPIQVVMNTTGPFLITPNVGAAFTVATINNANFSLTPTGVSSYTISKPSACASPITLNISQTNCSCAGTGTEITQSNLSNFIVGTNAYSFPAGNYFINSNITFPNNVNFTNADVKIAPNIELAVSSGYGVTITGSHFSSCATMWQGFKIASGASVKIQSLSNNVTSKPTLIEDAKIALNLLGNSGSYEISNSIFNKNDIAVKLANFIPNVAANTLVIKDNIFTCRQINISNWQASSITVSNFRTIVTTLISNSQLDDQHISDLTYPYSGSNAFMKAPLVGKKSSYGLYLDNVGAYPLNGLAIIGSTSSSSSFNLFDNLSVGILHNNCNLRISSNKFQNTSFGTNSLLSGANAGRGIKGQANADKRVIIEKSSFKDCVYGIDEREIYILDISNLNTFKSTQNINNWNTTHLGKYGIFIRGKRYETININNNRMYNIEEGITFLNSGQLASSSGQIEIKQNKIQADYDAQIGALTTQYVKNAIIVSCTGLTNNVAGTNILIEANTLNEVNNGIKVMNWAKPIVISAGTGSQAIKLRNSFPSENKIGIDYSNNTGVSGNPNIILNNTITGFDMTNSTSFGINYNISTNTNVYCNNLSNTYQGLTFSGSSAGSKAKRNKFANHRYGFVLSGSGTAIGPQGGNTATDRPADNEFNVTSNWSPPNYMVATRYAASPFGNVMTVHPQAPYNPNSSSIADNTSLFPYSTAFGNNTLVLSTLPNNVIQSCPNVTAIQTNPNAQSEKEHIKKRLNGEYPIEVFPIETDYNSKKQIYKLLKKDADLLDGEIQFSEFLSTNEYTNHGKLERIEENIALGNFTEAQNEILTLEDNYIDNNFKFMDELFIKYALDTLNTTDSLNLLDLANKCPLYDGSVVYQARAFFMSLYGSSITFDETACFQKNDEGGKKSIQLENISTDNSGTSFPLVVYPNPSKGEFYISNYNSYEIELFDLQGRKIQFTKSYVNDNVSLINLSCKNGFYNLIIKELNGITIKKIEVLK
jgi:hypothetical protein